jgi:hypothetical protein
MIKAILTAIGSKKALHTYDGIDGLPILVTTTQGHINGRFKAAQRSTAGTTIIASVNGDDALCLTDLILTTDKVNGSVTIQYTDGVNTVIIVAANTADAPCNIAIPFQGNWTGWKAAHIDMVTVGTVLATVSLGYYKIPADKALPYAAWNALR